MERKYLWALCLRSDLPTRGINTNNFLEAANRVLKDKVLFRIKAHSLTHLAGFIILQFSEHYCIKLTDVALGRQNVAARKTDLKSVKAAITIDKTAIKRVI